MKNSSTLWLRLLTKHACVVHNFGLGRKGHLVLRHSHPLFIYLLVATVCLLTIKFC